MLSICFYNNLHIGDVFFSSAFIRKICSLNQNHLFYYFIYYGHALLNDINNLNCIYKYTNNYSKELTIGYNATENYIDIDKSIIDIFNENNNNKLFEFKYNNQQFIGINMWCYAIKCDELDNINMDIYFNNLINELNNKYNINLYYNISNHILPIIPIVQTDIFNSWYNKLNNPKLVFIYNYYPRSIIFPEMQFFYKLLYKLAIKYSKLYFILPKYIYGFEQLDNIKFCDKHFNCLKEKPDCINLIQNERISRYCDIIFTLPTGCSWFFLNSDINISNKKYYLILNDKSDDYAERLNRCYQYYKNCDHNVVTKIKFIEICKIINDFNLS
jgi:hypothetical protein